MPCEPIVEDGKIIGWICTRSHEKPKLRNCYKCGKLATKLCDYRNCGVERNTDDYGRKIDFEWTSISTCNQPMCDECANHIDEDYCDEHNNEFSILKSRRAERICEQFDRNRGDIK